MTLNGMLDDILRAEGGYVNNPADRGGPTKFGITLATLRAARGMSVDTEDVQTLGEVEARSIYRKRYFLDPGFDQLSGEHVQIVMLDAAVQHGPAMAVKFLQRALVVKDDGVLGPETMVTARNRDSHRLALHCIAERLEFYGRIISKNLTDADKDGVPDNTEFAWGWMNRMSALIKAVS